MPTDTKPCKTCGAEFARSPADATVNCPSCRAGGAPKKARACVVCEGTGSVTYGPSASDPHDFHTVTCHRCEGSGVAPR